jgi:hypothetical protein
MAPEEDGGVEASYLEMTPDCVVGEGEDMGSYLEMAAADARFTFGE